MFKSAAYEVSTAAKTVAKPFQVISKRCLLVHASLARLSLFC
jgi:hypothetical protein